MVHQAEPLCKNYNYEEITKLRYVKTIHNPEEIKIFYCPRCRKEFHEYEVIWSNYEWLYRDELKEWDE